MKRRHILYWLLAGTLLAALAAVVVAMVYEWRSAGRSTADVVASTCDPLLLLVEGGSGSSDGVSIETLANQLGEEYRGSGVTVTNIDRGTLVDYGQQERARGFIESSNHSPIVIVGHSSGAQTAYEIAKQMDVALLVTLDGVSDSGHSEHIPHPRKDVQWIDIDAPGLKGNAWLGLDWNGQRNADRSVSVDSSHYDVEEMFSRVKEDVNRILMSCSSAVALGRANERDLCDVPGIECNVTWELTDACPEGPIIDVKFFEYDESDDRVDIFETSQVVGNGKSRFYLSCKSPGHWVCYGAANGMKSWGIGLDGVRGCTNCCAPCREGDVYPSGPLECDG